MWTEDLGGPDRPAVGAARASPFRMRPRRSATRAASEPTTALRCTGRHPVRHRHRHRLEPPADDVVRHVRGHLLAPWTRSRIWRYTGIAGRRPTGPGPARRDEAHHGVRWPRGGSTASAAPAAAAAVGPVTTFRAVSGTAVPHYRAGCTPTITSADTPHSQGNHPPAASTTSRISAL
jgi:hypothetical protein